MAKQITMNFVMLTLQPNQGVQLTPLARLLGWARSTRPMRYGLLKARHPPTFRRVRQPIILGALAVGHTHIAWYLPRAHVLHVPHACQRRS